MARYHLDHLTRYLYAETVSVSHHAAHLRPIDSERQRVRDFELTVTPRPADLTSREDFFGNIMHLFSLQASHKELAVRSTCEVSVQPPTMVMPELTPTCEEVRRYLADNLERKVHIAGQFAYPSPLVPYVEAARDFAAAFFAPEKPFLLAVRELSSAIYNEFTFDANATDVSTPVVDFFEQRRGVCQDFAHFALACIRAHRLPACYVSGYILTEPPPGQPRLVGADASHAWISAFAPGLGWIDFDPTNDLLCSDRHIIVAHGRDYADVSMLRGAVTGGGEHTLEIAVTVAPVGQPAPVDAPEA